MYHLFKPCVSIPTKQCCKFLNLQCFTYWTVPLKILLLKLIKMVMVTIYINRLSKRTCTAFTQAFPLLKQNYSHILTKLKLRLLRNKFRFLSKNYIFNFKISYAKDTFRTKLIFLSPVDIFYLKKEFSHLSQKLYKIIMKFLGGINTSMKSLKHIFLVYL